MSEEAIVLDYEEEVEQDMKMLKIVDETTAEEKQASKEQKRPRLTEEERRQLWEEKQKLKKVVETGVKGTVKWYSVLSHYGFICRDDGKDDLFVHQTAIAVSNIKRFNMRTLANHEEVVFDVVEGEKGLEAANVSGPNGEPVLGCKFFRWIIFGRRNAQSSKKPSDGKAVDDVKATAAKKKRKPRKNRHRKNSKADVDSSDVKKSEDSEVPAEAEPKLEKLEAVEVVAEEAAEVNENPDKSEEENDVTEKKPLESEVKTTEVRCGSVLGATGDASLGAEAQDALI